ncbi:MAG TPA: YfhO family protein [Thermoanaerobaculia bacterium]|nr:YfhO family protein [Thermoanaerobaculia bacterium]
MNPARRHDLIALAILALLASAFFADVLAGVSNFYMRDLTRYYYPAKQILREIVQGGEFPFWNRSFGGGQPLAANPEHEVFYPLTWLVLLPSYDLGYRLLILIHIYIGLFGMYAMLRSMEIRPSAAFVGALSFGLGGLYLSYINLLPILFCAAWLPLTCLYVRRFLITPTKRAFALASLFLGLQFLVGEPTTVMQTGLLIGMYALYRGWYDARELGEGSRIASMLVRVFWIAMISVAAMMVGAVQFFSALDHVGDSARSRPFEFSLVSAWSLPWAKYAELMYPNFLGHISINRVMVYWGGGLYPGMGSPFLFNIYCGLLITSLAIASAFVRPRGGRLVLLLVILSSLLALGAHTPLLKILYDAGIATSIRYPEKFIMIAVFAMIVFATQMLDRLMDGDRELRDAVLGFVLATTLVAIVIGIAGFTPLFGKTFSKIWGVSGAGAKRMIHLAHFGWLIAAARGLILFALIWSVGRIKRPIWIVALVAFICLDVGPVVHQINPRMPRSFFVVPPALNAKFPANRNDYRIFHESDWYGQEEIAKKYFSTGDAVYWIVRNGMYPMTPAGQHIRTVLERDYDKTALLPTIDLIDSVWDVKRSGRTDWWQPFVTMSNAWYRVVYKPFDEEKKRVKGNMKRADPVQLLEVEHSPRYYFADQLVTIVDRNDFVGKLRANSYSSRVAFVYTPSFVPASGNVRGVRETANYASILVESNGRGYLVMSITPHKYWRVTIDGRPVQPRVTNIAYQGIEIPPGKHHVEMRYRNDVIVKSSFASCAGTLALLLVAILPVRRRR